MAWLELSTSLSPLKLGPSHGFWAGPGLDITIEEEAPKTMQKMRSEWMLDYFEIFTAVRELAAWGIDRSEICPVVCFSSKSLLSLCEFYL